MKITKTKDCGVDKLKMIIYGEPGSGKTTLAGTIGEPTLIISAESGLLSLRGHSIDVIDMTTDDYGVLIPKEKRITRLQAIFAYLLTEECKSRYKWIFIDSLTEISQNLVEQLQLEFPERKDSLVLYGENAKRMRSLIKSFRDLPHYGVIFTALSTIDKDENNQRFTGLSLIGKIADSAPGLFDEVFYLATKQDPETGAIERRLITSKTEKLVAKDRSGVLNHLEPADLGLIIKKIRGESNV